MIRKVLIPTTIIYVVILIILTNLVYRHYYDFSSFADYRYKIFEVINDNICSYNLISRICLISYSLKRVHEKNYFRSTGNVETDFLNGYNKSISVLVI